MQEECAEFRNKEAVRKVAKGMVRRIYDQPETRDRRRRSHLKRDVTGIF